MNPRQFSRQLQQKARALELYGSNQFPVMAGQKILRFINGNFRAQGWQGDRFQPWKKNARGGTILVNKGRLRRNFRQQTGRGFVRTFNDTPYARVHNNGFNGTVNVRSHTRRKYTATKVGTGRFNRNGTERKKTVHVHTGDIQVSAHTRKVNIEKRQFMPITNTDSPVLMKSIERDVINQLKSIFEK